MSSVRRAGILAGLLLWVPAAAWAQDPIALEETLLEVAEHAIPRTVLIQSHTADGQMGAGSGALISADGWILTCTHVIEVGQRTEVVLSDGTSYEGRVVGRNVRQDFSLVKIDAQGLPFFAQGDSRAVAAGDWVVALGHPGGPYADLQPAFALGKVRALERRLPVGFMSKYYNHAIMTDCPIFAGDSGGPLLDLEGNLIGINGAILMINEYAFAVPLHQIQEQLPRLQAGETIEGETPGPEAFQEMQELISPEDYQEMMRRAMDRFNLPEELQGMMEQFFGPNGEMPDLGELFGGGNGEMPDLSELFGGGNGEMPDLSELFGGGNGEMPDLSELFGGEMPDLNELFGGGNGEMPDLSELFGGGNGEMPDLGELFGGGNGEGPDLQEMMRQMERLMNPQQPDRPARPAQPAQPQRRGSLGLRAAPNDPQLEGVLVEEVVDGGPAAGAGLRRGDVILSLDGRPTTNLNRLGRALNGKGPGETVTLRVQRLEIVDGVPVDQLLDLSVVLGER